MGDHGHQNGDPNWPGRVGGCHTQRSGDATEAGQIAKISFKLFISLDHRPRPLKGWQVASAGFLTHWLEAVGIA